MLLKLENKLILLARSHNPILRIRFLVLKIGSSHSDVPTSRFRFCGENVGRSFVMCSPSDFQNSQRIVNLAPKRSQGYHPKLIGTFHPSRRVSDENRACSISIPFFSKLMDPCVGRSFLMCSHDPIFGTNKNRILTLPVPSLLVPPPYTKAVGRTPCYLKNPCSYELEIL